MNTQTRRPLLLLFIWLGLVVIACNLTDTAPPPSLVPRATSTPPPTIGYATLAPNEYPSAATQVAAVPQQPNLSLANLLGLVAQDRLFMHVSSLVNMKTRHVNSSYTSPNEGIGAAERYVLSEYNAIRQNSYQQAFSVFTQDFPVDYGGVKSTATNIIGVMQGYETGAGVLVLGAHYDSITIDFENGAAYAPGADDDASGIAVLLEIARIMSQKRHRATVMFVAFSAEEIQRKGSIAFVQDYLQGQNYDIIGMLNMDIVGSDDDASGAINDKQMRLFSADPNESRSRQLARAMSLIAERSGAPLQLNVEAVVDREGRYSDHMSFSDAGYPAVRFIEANEERDRQHTDRDTIDDIQPAYLVHATQTILTVMTAMADGPRPPTSISLRDAGNGLRTLVWGRTPDAASYVVALRPPGALDYGATFNIADNSVTWEGFYASRYVGVAIAAMDANGLIGPFSQEYAISS